MTIITTEFFVKSKITKDNVNIHDLFALITLTRMLYRLELPARCNLQDAIDYFKRAGHI